MCNETVQADYVAPQTYSVAVHSMAGRHLGWARDDQAQGWVTTGDASDASRFDTQRGAELVARKFRVGGDAALVVPSPLKGTATHTGWRAQRIQPRRTGSERD